MSAKKASKPDKMMVYLNMWPLKGEPRLQAYMHTANKLTPCKTLEAARDLARELGYSGITIKPV